MLLLTDPPASSPPSDPPTRCYHPQDIASYGIARTLGVVDAVKASTSDKATVHHPTATLRAPAIHISASDSDAASSEYESDRPAPPATAGSSGPSLFYVGEGSGLALSGVGVFSPAASQPPSPTLSRQSLAGSLHEGTGEQLRRRAPPPRDTS